MFAIVLAAPILLFCSMSYYLFEFMFKSSVILYYMNTLYILANEILLHYLLYLLYIYIHYAN